MDDKKETNDNKLIDVSGGREEYTIKPIDGDTWKSFDPKFVNGSVPLNNVDFKGNVGNRDDDSGFNTGR